jgi:putative membrane protein
MMGGGLLVFLLIVGVIAYALGWRPDFLEWMNSGGDQPPGDSAEEILKRRYARGEISKEEYDQMRRDLHE